MSCWRSQGLFGQARHGGKPPEVLAVIGSLPTADAIAAPPGSGPPLRAWTASEPPAGSLLHFYRHSFRPELRPQLCAKDLARYDAAINRFMTFAGGRSFSRK